MPEATIEARFLGGAYDGQTDRVPADEDKLLGTVPALRTIRRAQPPVFRLTPEAEVFGDAAMQTLYYRCEHRGGEWVYVLLGTDPASLPPETDPLLEMFIAHVRRVWPRRRHAGNTHAVPAEAHQTFGVDYEEYTHKRLLAGVHAAANAEGMLLIRVDGPHWTSIDHGYTDVCRVEGLAIPGFGMRDLETGE